MRWFFLLPVWVIINLFAVLFGNWWFPLFAEIRLGPIDNDASVGIEPRLPDWLSWFMTPDNSLWGDGGFKDKHDKGYWSQVAWLYRNSCYGFERSVLAAIVTPYDKIDVYGDPFISDKPNGKEGFCLVNIGDYWSFDWVICFTKTKCMKIGLGWKLKTYAENRRRLETEHIAQYCVTIKPLTDFVE